MKNDRKKIYHTKNEIRLFFKQKGIVYLRKTRVEWKPLLSMKLDQSPYFRANEEEFKKLNKKYAEKIEKGYMASVYIKELDENLGVGVFSGEDIKKDDLIGEYAGVVQIAEEGSEIEDGKGYESDFSWYYLDEIKGGPSLEISGRLEGNEMRFVNHGLNPNVDVEHMLHNGQWIIFFKAAINILKDEQLLINYGDEYWSDGYRELVNL